MNPKITNEQIHELSECYEKQIENLSAMIEHIVLTTLFVSIQGGLIEPSALMQVITDETLALNSEMRTLRQKIEEFKTLLKE